MEQSKFQTFYFADIDKSMVLGAHEFYVSEARNRVLTQFSDVVREKEAKEIENSYLDKRSKNFDPDLHDPADIYEDAYFEGLDRWLLLTEMQNTVTLGLTAGMYHQFDKALREKVVQEFSQLLDSDLISPIVWDLTFLQLIELLELIGMDIVNQDFFCYLDACRLVVNVYKHGIGNAHTNLISKYPEYYFYGKPEMDILFPPNYKNLTVTERQFTNFANAITDFWKNIPERCCSSQFKEVPTWLDEKIKNQEKRLARLKRKES
ncbi:hypothetical protein [Paenalcaligenes faecalis]|uniref:hypothetical protein n=1 Tax=Paenalcaligenes faecalis TaxID=2980099 RepID=UPI0022B9AC54|nr:hypothetical protein [Paenalcaligenes faecalis]